MNRPPPPFNGINLINQRLANSFYYPLASSSPASRPKFFNSKREREKEKKYQRKESSIFASLVKARYENSNFRMDTMEALDFAARKTRSKPATVAQQRNYTCHVNIRKRSIRQAIRTMPSLRYHSRVARTAVSSNHVFQLFLNESPRGEKCVSSL